MKRFTMIVALLLLVAVPMMAERVSPETARKVATTFLNNNGAKSAQLIDLSKAAGFANLYIFNGNPGFVVMAADDCVKPILSYSLTGKFVAEGMPENVRWWLKGYNDQIQDAIDSHAKATSEIAKQWENLMAESGNPTKAITVVGPLITTNWDQWYPYNYYCPSCSVYSANGGHALTGCVATAMAQVIKYHNAPVHGIGSHSYTHSTFGQLSVDFSSTNYDWTNMPTQISSSSSSTQIQAVATLIYHCGVAVDMNYGRTSSGAYSTNIAPALKNYFNFSQSTAYHERANYSNSDWISLMRNELNNSRPIVYGGFDDATNPSSGHSFVCDGYDADNYSDLYFHFNWGWSGSYNGYFSIDDMTPGGNGAGGGNHDYTYLQDAVIGIQPSTNTAIPSNLTYSLTGLQNLTLSWSAASGAASYNIYRNNNLVGSTTETTYTETAPFGTNVYWVRSVDANNEISLSSNTVTVTIAYQTPVVNDLGAALSGNDVVLNWTAPEWCYPETPTATLTYGDEGYSNSAGYNGSNTMYWGHRYLSSTLDSYAEMVIYKISFYASVAGTYQYLIYKGTNTYNNSVYPKNQIANGTITTSGTGWFNINLNENLPIDESQDLWVFMYDPEYKNYPASFCNFSDHSEGCYYTSSNPLNTPPNTYSGVAWLIRTYLTDGTYTYNLYDGTTTVASNINATNYTISNVTDDAAHQYTVKTNYYGGESAASNMAGLTLGTASLSSLELGENDKMTVTEGSTLTVTGAISNSNAANLVLEDGAQLVSGPVSGTMLKSITGTDFGTQATPTNAGYCLIASPVAGINPDDVDNMTDGTYDLYAYDATQTAEWRNYKATSFTLGQGVGYLYANNTTTTLGFAGLLNDNFSGISNLNYDASSTLNSLNLVGDPYAHQAEFSILNNGSWVSESNYLTLNAAGDGFISNTFLNGKIVLNPMQAVLVQATAVGESFEEYSDIIPIDDGPEIPFDAVRGTVNIQVLNSDGIMADNAIVRFDEGGMMRKLYLSNSSTRIYIPRGNNEMAIVRSDNESELPVNFKASSNGTYTLNVDNESLGLEYLHLIDNLTGVETDLLETPSYTFEAKTTDYASRFRLVFSNGEDAVGDNATFAYVNNGNIVVNEEGTLQIVDMTGRVIVSRSGRIQCVATAGMTPGVYVLRLITADGVKTQKIVIE